MTLTPKAVASRRVSHRGSLTGFTLVELMVALAVVAVSLATLYGAMAGAGQRLAEIEQQRFGQWIAANRLTDLRFEQAWPSLGINSGRSDYGGRVWRWREQVLSTSNPRLRRVDLQLWPASFDGVSGPSAVVRLSGFLARPVKARIEPEEASQ